MKSFLNCLMVHSHWSYSFCQRDLRWIQLDLCRPHRPPQSRSDSSSFSCCLQFFNVTDSISFLTQLISHRFWYHSQSFGTLFHIETQKSRDHSKSLTFSIASGTTAKSGFSDHPPYRFLRSLNSDWSLNANNRIMTIFLCEKANGMKFGVRNHTCCLSFCCYCCC